MKTKLKSSIIAYHMAVGHRVAAAMVCALCAVGLAAVAEPQKIGDSEVTWELPENNTVLTIAGTGAMPDFEKEGAPWYSQKGSIQTLEIKSGVTHLGEYAFLKPILVS